MKQLLLLLVLTTLGCSTVKPPATVENVDLERFMGDWYVHSGLLTGLEKDIYNAVEHYELDEKGRIQTTYTFRKGGFDGKEKRYTPVGFVHDEETNAEWRMQFIWPIRLPYYIIHLDEDYQVTAIGTQNRKYLWVMSRESHPDQKLINEAYDTAKNQGYVLDDIQIVPHQKDDQK